MPEDEGQAGATPTEPQDPKPTEPELGDGGKKAIDAERARARAAERRAAEAEAKLKAAADEKLSDQEKVAKRAAEAEDRAVKAEGRALRYEAAAESGLPLTLAMRLQGSTKEELLADAESLKSQLAPAATATNGDGQGGTEPPATAANRRIPRPDMSQGGGRPTDGKSIAAGAALFEQRKQSKTPFTT